MTDEERATANDEFGRKSMELAEKIATVIAVEDWGLVNSALLQLVANGMLEPSLTPAHLEWLHTYILNLHDMVHDRMDKGPLVLIIGNLGGNPDADDEDIPPAPEATPAPRCLH